MTGGLDDTWQFVLDRNEAYIESNLVEETFVDNKINLIAVVNTSGEIVWKRVLDLESRREIELKEFSSSPLVSTHPILSAREAGQTVSGIFMTSAGPMMNRLAPDYHERQSGAVRGNFIVGRLLIRTAVKELAEQTQIYLNLWPLSEAPDYAERIVVHLINYESPKYSAVAEGNLLRAFTLLHDIQGSPVLLVEVRGKREIVRRGNLAVRFMVASGILGGILVIIVLRVALNRLVLSRFRGLSQALEQVEQTRDLSIRVPAEGQDELTQLCRRINGMLSGLKHAEDRIVQSETNYREAIESASGVPYRLRFGDNRYEFFGSGLEALLEIPLKEFGPGSLGGMVREVHSSKTGQSIDCAEYCGQFRRGEIPLFQVDYRVVTPGGKEKWISDCAVPIANETTGEVIGCLGILQDITERKQFEAALRQKSEFVDAIIQTAEAAVVVLDAEGRIQRMNRACERITGYTRGEAEGQRLADLFLRGSSVDVEQDAMNRLRAGEQPLEYEIAWTARDGQTRLMSLYGSVLLNPLGEVEHLIESGLDITQHRTLEKEILAVSEREQQRMGRELHDGLCQQLGGISFLSEALEEALRREASPLADKAAKIGSAIRDALGQARTLARGGMPVGLESEGLAEALQEMARGIQEIYAIPCQVECAPGFRLNDRAIAAHLYRIGQESMLNAARHARARRLKVDLFQDNGLLTLSVEDDGCGFSEETLARGGMGLHILRYRARLIDAQLKIDSAPGQGTRVVCTLKMPKEEETVSS
jgi:PAS domain S-box-containing protein